MKSENPKQVVFIPSDNYELRMVYKKDDGVICLMRYKDQSECRLGFSEELLFEDGMDLIIGQQVVQAARECRRVYDSPKR